MSMSSSTSSLYTATTCILQVLRLFLDILNFAIIFFTPISIRSILDFLKVSGELLTPLMKTCNIIDSIKAQEVMLLPVIWIMLCTGSFFIILINSSPAIEKILCVFSIAGDESVKVPAVFRMV